jgi:UDPglucose--hexose-1-phosphate uridylyltransferase
MKKKETEFRYDALNGDWVILSPRRADRFKAKIDPTQIKECPFCNIKLQEDPVLIYSHGIKTSDLKNWTTAVIPNKYPMVVPVAKHEEKKNGLYKTVKAGGFHEVVVYKDHNKDLFQLPLDEIEEIIDCFQDRINEFKKYDFVKAALVFHNRGEKAGATQVHPHSQILAVPLIDKEFRTTLENSEKHYEDNSECLQCLINRTEKREKKRIVFENEDFLCYVPFAPKFAFEVTIVPKKHSPRFESMMERERKRLAEALKVVLSKLSAGFNDLSYNFYIRTAPFDKDYAHFHWYLVVFPRIHVWAGFELGAGMEVSTILPEDAAEFLKKQKYK